MAKAKAAPCIVFYSYKGGTSKTLSTVQLSAILAEMGRRVCVIDFDLEAPGLSLALPALLGLDALSTSQAVSTLGVVDYIDDFSREAQNRGWLMTCGTCGTLIPTKELKLQELHSALAPVGPKAVPQPWGKGHIYWISAGRLAPNADKDSYWTKLHSRNVQAVLENNEWSAPFFQAFIERVRDELKVDYILVDSRSGINELSGVCTRAIADKLVLLLGLQEEGYYGTNRVLQTLEDARKQPQLSELCGPSPSNIFIVASRIPEHVLHAGKSAYIKRNDENLRQDDSVAEYSWPKKREYIRNRLSVGLRSGFNYGIFVLASATNLEWEQRLPFLGRKEALRSILPYDYIDLFESLLSAEEPKLRQQLLPYTKEVYVLRPYYLDKGSGMILNPDDGQANVAFTVPTYVATIEAVCRGIATILQSSKEPPPSDDDVKRTVEETLFDIGNSAVAEFSKYLAEVRFAGRDKGKATLWEEVLEWCEFDSSVGFGRFEAQPWGRGDEEGQIVVHNNFLARNRDKEKQNLCSFLTGYISRVLGSIYAPHSVTVTHDLVRGCGHMTPPPNGADPDCVFVFTVNRGSATGKRA